MYNGLCDDMTTQSINRSTAVGADLVDGPLKFLTSYSWLMTRVGAAVCLAVASLVANRCLLLDVLHLQLADVDKDVRGRLYEYNSVRSSATGGATGYSGYAEAYTDAYPRLKLGMLNIRNPYTYHSYKTQLKRCVLAASIDVDATAITYMYDTYVRGKLIILTVFIVL